ncbi:ABC transporter permease [Actinocrispum wychmicini]|uniref:Osmoprotectant transport system permease protein n=1 Tax=Actinocrispum wychmicini TaxID=1213861 RepID=A0A4R2K719_9PSEU|nr:ABC transporter permease subunit [Actinocrispum wychmicini]TCO65739.1 osmoprotectant transport system permease protein [Actinocrispum wychmicini]
MNWIFDHVGDIVYWTGQHLWLSLLPVAIGLVISIPLGWVANRWRVARAILVPVAGILYTIPSLVLLVMLPALLGTQILNPINVVIALTIYTVALLVRVVADSLAAVPPPVIAAANAMGYRPVRRFLGVELPLAIPVLVAGLRVATVSNISLVSVGGLLGVKQLGYAFPDGYGVERYSEIIAGLVLIILLALLFDRIWLLVGRLLTPWTRAGVAK